MNEPLANKLKPTKLEDVIGFDLLDEKLQEVIIYRKKYPDVSLNDFCIIMTEETNKTISLVLNELSLSMKNKFERSDA